MIQLVYVSSARNKFEKAELLKLLEVAREKNSKHQITGILLFKEGSFIQVLEGEENDVESLYQNISMDPRHSGVLTLLKHPIKQRDFAEWSMAFRELDDPAIREVAGFNELLNSTIADARLNVSGSGNSKAKRLVTTFIGLMR